METFDTPSGSMQGKWYVLQALSGQENRALERLKISCEQDRQQGIDNGIESMQIPVDKIDTGRKDKSGKPILRDKKRFPGYILVKARLFQADDERDPHTWEIIHRTQGVIGFIGKDRPVEIKQEQVDEMMAASASAERPKQRVDYVVGEKVLIREEPFMGYKGEIVDIDLEHNTLKLLVSVFSDGGFTPVDLPIDAVERIADEKNSTKKV